MEVKNAIDLWYLCLKDRLSNEAPEQRTNTARVERQFTSQRRFDPRSKVMHERSQTNRRRFLLSSGALAAGWELARADIALAQELTPTPACHDGDEPTVSQ